MERAIRGIASFKILPDKHELVKKLQNDVYALQRHSKAKSDIPALGLGPIVQAFPKQTFPTGAVHEFISYKATQAATTTGFIAALSARLMQEQGTCLWISTKRTLFPPALKQYGINASRIIFIDLIKERDVLWVVEEALKCQSLSLVVGEISEISFNDSRRLQLAVEQSNVTALLHRNNPRSENTLASVARWKIAPLASSTGTDLPGVGYSRWRVELSKVRNGRPDIWDIEWSKKGFKYLSTETTPKKVETRKSA
ncbi:MAG: ImuA family protein [Flavipsychrobacter sp.]